MSEQLNVGDKVSTRSKSMDNKSMRAQGLCTTFWRAPDNDTNCLLRRIVRKGTRDVVRRVKLCRWLDLDQEDWLPFLGWRNRNRDAPESELVCINIVEIVGFLELD